MNRIFLEWLKNMSKVVGVYSNYNEHVCSSFGEDLVHPVAILALARDLYIMNTILNQMNLI